MKTTYKEELDWVRNTEPEVIAKEILELKKEYEQKIKQAENKLDNHLRICRSCKDNFEDKISDLRKGIKSYKINTDREIIKLKNKIKIHVNILKRVKRGK